MRKQSVSNRLTLSCLKCHKADSEHGCVSLQRTLSATPHFLLKNLYYSPILCLYMLTVNIPFLRLTWLPMLLSY